MANPSNPQTSKTQIEWLHSIQDFSIFHPPEEHESHRVSLNQRRTGITMRIVRDENKS